MPAARHPNHPANRSSHPVTTDRAAHGTGGGQHLTHAPKHTAPHKTGPTPTPRPSHHPAHRGGRGAPGPAGAPGPTGASGPAGPAGPAGPSGTGNGSGTGASGPAATPGTTATNGTTAPVVAQAGQVPLSAAKAHVLARQCERWATDFDFWAAEAGEFIVAADLLRAEAQEWRDIGHAIKLTTVLG